MMWQNVLELPPARVSAMPLSDSDERQKIYTEYTRPNFPGRLSEATPNDPWGHHCWVQPLY